MIYYIRDDDNNYLHLDGWHTKPTPITTIHTLIQILKYHQHHYDYIPITITTNHT